MGPRRPNAGRIHRHVAAKPIAVDRTEVTIYPIRLVGAPAAMNFGNIRLLNVTHSAASFVQTDDLESFVRAQKGLRSHATDWVDISRGLGDEEPDRELNATRALATHEMVVRAQYKAWLGYMREGGVCTWMRGCSRRSTRVRIRSRSS